MTRLLLAAALLALGAAVEYFRAGGTRHARRQTAMVAGLACKGDCQRLRDRAEAATRWDAP